MNKRPHVIDEVNVFHPLVAKWLKSNGYTYKHEYKMPDYGRVDFYATHKQTGRKLLVECKSDIASIRKGVIQSAAYGLQIPEAQPVLAVPSGWMRKKWALLAERYEVEVLEIEIPINSSAQEPLPIKEPIVDNIFTEPTPSLELIGMLRGSNAYDIMRRPQYVANKVARWHEENDSSPALDYLVLWYCVNQSNPEVYSNEDCNNAFKVYMEALAGALDDDRYTFIALEGVREIMGNTKLLFSLGRITGTTTWER